MNSMNRYVLGLLATIILAGCGADTPDTSARPVLIDRFHRHVAATLEGLGSDDLREKNLTSRISVKD